MELTNRNLCPCSKTEFGDGSIVSGNQLKLTPSSDGCKKCFLNGDLDKEVYMDLPPMFELTRDRKKVCKLKKSLYGLKQSPWVWFDKFSNMLRHLGMTKDKRITLFSKHSREGKIVILSVYVDDIILTRDDCEESETEELFVNGI